MKRGAYKRETPQLGLGLALEESNAGVGDEHDFFPTPSWPTLAIWPRIYTPAVRIVLDPCCGDGGILGALPAPLQLVGLEIDEERARRCEMRTNIRPEVRDSLEGTWPICDWVVQNPPFALAEAFVRKALLELQAGRVRCGVAVLLRLAFLESAERVPLHSMYPAEVHVLANRPCFIDPQAWRPCPKCGGVGYIPAVGAVDPTASFRCKGCGGRGEVKGGTDSTAYAWFCWRAGGIGAGTWSVLPDRDPAKKEVRRRAR